MSKRRQNFAAHKASICCAAWGKKYGGLFATGGEDQVVNVWRLGAAHKLKALDGLFNSAVTAVVFNTNETKLAAGTEGGTVRVYDFEHDKVLRTLNGHLTACTSLHFHPYASNYVVSTSKDNHLKVWDLRGKKCLNTFRGHSDAVLCSRFSPDGRLVATGAADGAVKVWDLTSGKQMASFDGGGGGGDGGGGAGHRGAVTDLCFHPFEFVLASASGPDRSVKLWDIEDFSLISTTPGVTTAGFASAKVLFNGKGGEDDDSADGDGANGTTAGGARGAREENEMICFGGAGVRTYCWEQGARGSTRQVACDWDTGPGTSVADVMPHPKKEGVYQACLIHRTHVSIWRVDTAAAQPLGGGDPDSRPASSAAAARPAVGSGGSRGGAATRTGATVRRATPTAAAAARADAKLQSASDDDDDGDDDHHRSAAAGAARAADTDEAAATTPRRVTTARPRTSEQPLVRRPSSMQKGRVNSPVRRGSSRGGVGSAGGGFVPAHRRAPVGLNYASFLSANLTAYNNSEVAHKRAAAKVLANYEQHLQAFESRGAIAAKAAALWGGAGGSVGALLQFFSRSNGGPAGSSAVVLGPEQVDVFVAAMRRVRLRSSGLALKDLRLLVPLLTEVARNTDRNDGYQLTAVLLLGQLVDMFEGVITQTLRGGRTPAARRDVVFAERLDKVEAVVGKLESLNRVVEGLRSARGLVGFHARYLSKHLATILSSA